jgi:hypothetical protein
VAKRDAGAATPAKYFFVRKESLHDAETLLLVYVFSFLPYLRRLIPNQTLKKIGKPSKTLITQDYSIQVKICGLHCLISIVPNR